MRGLRPLRNPRALRFTPHLFVGNFTKKHLSHLSTLQQSDLPEVALAPEKWDRFLPNCQNDISKAMSVDESRALRYACPW
jgi:hypothetical protein